MGEWSRWGLRNKGLVGIAISGRTGWAGERGKNKRKRRGGAKRKGREGGGRSRNGGMGNVKKADVAFYLPKTRWV